MLGLGLRAYAVVKPVANPADDSHAYYALSKALYEEGSYGGPEFHDSSDWSPGAPLLYAASFYATGGAREGTARIVEALLGVAAILVVFLLGRPARRRAAAGLLARPSRSPSTRPFIHSTGELMSEPPAILTLPAAVLAFLWASEQRAARAGPGCCPGFLFGLTAMFRPEYLLVGAAFVVLAAIRVGRGARLAARPGRRRRCCSPPCCCRSSPGRSATSTSSTASVPISTGSGKALYVGTFLPADGEYQRVKALPGRALPAPRPRRPTPRRSNEVDPTPLFDRVAARYPDLPRDSALGKIGKQNFSKYFGEDPLGYAGDDRAQGRADVEQRGRRSDEQRRSAGRSRSCSSRSAWPASSCSGCAGAGGSWSRWRRRSSLVTAVGAASLAAPRRNEVLMTLVFPLAALALSRAGRGHILRPRMVPQAGIFPAELTALRAAGLLVAIGDRRLRGRCAAARCATSTC